MSANRPIRNQLLGGTGLVLFGMLMLWRGRFALLHDTVLFPRYPWWGKSAWMNPWQAVAVAVVCFILGAVLLIHAMRKRRQVNAKSSGDSPSEI